MGEDVSYLVVIEDVLSDEKSKGNIFMHKMVIQLNMFAMSVKHRIDRHVQSIEIVTVED
jgi:hypothetical protein